MCCSPLGIKGLQGLYQALAVELVETTEQFFPRVG